MNFSLLATSLMLFGGMFGEPPVRDSSFNLISPGTKISIGTFVEGFDPSVNEDNIHALLLNWKEFKSTRVELPGDYKGPGMFMLEAREDDGEVEGYQFGRKKVYVLITQTVDQQNPLMDGSNVREYGVFTSDSVWWFFPPPWIEGENDLDQNVMIGTGQINFAYGASIHPEFGPLLSSLSSPWQSWKESVFGSSAIDISYDTEVGRLGLTALEVYVLYSSPDASSLPYRLEQSAFVFQRRTEQSCQFKVEVEISEDLVTWDVLPDQVVIDQHPDNVDVEIVRVTVSSRSKCFFRLRINK